ncbi:MAG: hypothetical protein L3J09_02335 [Flavobacteriaceae bacterium]|nr:hypothetical protein [Flavobacteriaceae bacterium]
MSFFKNNNTSFYSEKSVLKISDIVSWKRERNIYNFEALPPIAIISINKSVFSKKVSSFTKKIKGINGLHYNFKSKFLLSSEFGMGSSGMITLLEELKELGVKQFVFIGVAGILDHLIVENNAYIISNVYSSAGSSFFYSKEENIISYDKIWFEKVKDHCGLKSKTSWSTDCPFRETKQLIENYSSKKCALVEMETAGLYAFSQFYKVPSVSILIGADSLYSLQWNAPKDIDKILKTQQELVNKLLKL